MREKSFQFILLSLMLVLIPAGARAFDRGDPDLLGYWSLDEGSGTIIADLSSNGYNGTLNGGVSWTDGIYGGALHFDGSDGYVGTGESFLNDVSGFTLAGWVSASNIDVYSSLFGQNDLIEFGFIGGSQLGTWLLGNDWVLVAADYTFEYPSWHHVALTGDASGVVIYIDGKAAASDAGSVSSGSSGDTFNIGGNVFNTSGDPFLGEIDDVWVFSRALTAEEMQVLMQGTGGYPYAMSPNPADGGIHPDTWITLSWQPGDFAVSHDVYLGDNFDDVNDGTGGTFRGNQTTTFYVAGFPGFAFPEGLVPGTTYYWRIDEVNEADPNSPWKGEVWSFFIPPRTAYNPTPADGAMFVKPDVMLSWSPGMLARLHTIYFGDNFDDVNDATGGIPQANPSYNPGPLELDTTYYWRVDEFDGAVTRKGDVWSFTTTIPGLGLAIAERWENIGGDDLDNLKNDDRFPNDPDITEVVTAFSWNGPDADDYGGRIHSWLYAPATGDYTFWLNSDNQGELWLSIDDDSSNVRLIAQESSYTNFDVWASGEEQSEPIPLVGGQRYYIMALWKEGSGGDHCQVAWQGPGVPTRVVVPGSNLAPYEPMGAYGAKPLNGAVDVTQTPILEWKPGLQAASHELYFGTDEEAVRNATKASPEYKGAKALGDESYDPGTLAWETTYYWRVDEINDLHPDSPWVGKVWSFTTAGFLIVDNFESYTDDDAAGQAIWQTWIDGFGVPENGAQVGYLLPPYAERSIVHNGSQSMPLYYDNTANVTNSEATLTLSRVRDWTEEGVADLSLWFRGQTASVGSFIEEPVGTYTMTATGADIWNAADEFHYAYKRLNGSGSMEVQVLSVQDTDSWAKAGVMIRETLEAGSKFAAIFITPENGCRFQARATANADAIADDAVASTTQTAITAPYWVKLERDASGNFRGYYSSNGTTWQPMTWNSQSIPMSSNVYIGLALTAHNANAVCEAKFSDVRTAGGVSGQWTHRDIGLASNIAEPLYVAVSNSGGSPAVVAHENPAAATMDTWTEWRIPLQAFTDQGINLTNVDTIAIGLGDKGGTATGGSGTVYIDDIRLYRP
ncbi:MAG: hypothetical protein JXM79_10305 [Sedimentisphaerales bacterium]|nr:hypothetical protein [Sedimentisphaerales bacterium]